MEFLNLVVNEVNDEVCLFVGLLMEIPCKNVNLFS